ncbi:MAG: hypothetical protein QME51_00790 [Planctomycetota bacterium]|nr:hypothetical protein [Planctomycetota bacterium]
MARRKTYKEEIEGMELGGGERFQHLKTRLSKRQGVKSPGALAAFIGRKRYGKERFQKMAVAGRKK